MNFQAEQQATVLQRTLSRSLSPLPFSERRLVLIALDLLAVNGALLLALALRPGYGLEGTLVLRHPLWFLLLSLLWMLIAQTFDAYDPRVVAKFSSSARSVLQAGLITAGVYLLIPYVTPPLPTSRSALLAFPLFAVGALLAGRGLYRVVMTQPALRRRALIIGAGWAGRTIAEALAEHGDGTYQVVGFVDDDPAKLGRGAWEPGSRGEFTSAPLHLRTSAPQPPSTRALKAPPLVLGNRSLPPGPDPSTSCGHSYSGDHARDQRRAAANFNGLPGLGVEIIPMPVLYEQLTGRVPVEHVGSNWYVAMPLSHPLTRTFNRMIKRAMDIVLASLGMLFLAPFLPFIALAIYLDSPGPIFYTQERVGEGGRIFKVYKFRSMVPDAEKGRAVWAQENDPRVTRVGRILRKTHLDEFPQFLNILKGEMSAVGPRPERPEFVEELAREIPFYRVRHAVKPGMAGWALVKYGYASSKEDALIRLQYDLYYIKHWSPWLDLVILLKTVVDTLTLRGRA
jgi:exopolysaccharide biosynthesis polyprenyl glycosylphosphotransferase